MKDAITFVDYDRITDKILWLSQSMSLTFVVSLASKDKQGARRSFYYETEYNSNYIGSKTGRSIKRNIMSYYFIIETSSFGKSFVIKPRDVYYLTNAIDKNVLPWFFGDKRIFSIKDDKLKITKSFNPLLYQTDEYNYLSINPISLENETGYKEGTRIEVNGEYADIDIDKFIDFYYILLNTDMYNAACELINFVKIEPYGTNIYKPSGLGAKQDIDWNEKQNKIPKSNRNSFLDNK
jgi:hypothetical protein